MTTIAEQVKAFRTARGWSVQRMASEVKTSRQNIENLEAGTVELPSYVVSLADTMNCSIDTLLGRSTTAGYTAGETPAQYRVGPSLEDSLQRLGTQLAAVHPDLRDGVGENLRMWATSGGADHFRDIVLMLLTRTPDKRTGTAG